MASSVLDASALLALLQDEPGADQVVAELAAGALMSTVNLAEVVTKLAERGADRDRVLRILDGLSVQFVELTHEAAIESGLIRPGTRRFGLSLGDRCCVALAIATGLPVVTAERLWSQLAGTLPVEVRLIR
jgi:PIN domain nuclease of toxin-antitoxin system